MSRAKKKLFIFIVIGFLLLSAGAVFTLGGFGRFGPDAAPNLAEYGLVGYWNMEEGKGQTVYDRSGNGNNGTLGASTAVAKDDPVFTGGYSSSGPGGTALKFDGKDDYVNAGNAASLNITNAITIETWVNLAAPTANTYSAFIKKEGAYEIMLRSSDRQVWWALGTTNYWAINLAGYILPQNTWKHLVLTYDGTSGGSFYVDGTKIQDIAADGAISTTGNNLGFGHDLYGLSQQFPGSIDSVRIYNRALSADEIRQHYNQKKPILEWKFDEGSGTSTKDESFNNNDGTLHE